MTSSHDRKQAWLAYSGLNNSAQDRRLRDRVAALFDIESPSRLQQEILERADVRQSLLSLPANAYRQQQQEFVSLIKREILLNTLKKLAWFAPLPLLLAVLAALFIR